ncbi:MAG TPA: radical SAM protein [Chitinivibrionales bacterium]|nr:radical SAM protein [Chitinivibrionales bacterium]
MTSNVLWPIDHVELTNACNFHCNFCPSDSLLRPRTSMKRPLWEKILRELGEKKLAETVCFHVLGEPLLHPELFGAIEFANGLGLAVSLFTNGSLLNEAKSRRLLKSLTRGCLGLSIQDIHPDTFGERCKNSLTWYEYLGRLRDLGKFKAAQIERHMVEDFREHAAEDPSVV